MDDLVSWLSEHQLDDYAEVFRRERISLSDLSLLSDEDLRELGLPMGPRRRLFCGHFDRAWWQQRANRVGRCSRFFELW